MDKTERRERVSVREDSIELALEFPRARPISAKQRKAIEDQLWNAWSDNVVDVLQKLGIAQVELKIVLE